MINNNDDVDVVGMHCKLMMLFHANLIGAVFGKRRGKQKVAESCPESPHMLKIDKIPVDQDREYRDRKPSSARLPALERSIVRRRRNVFSAPASRRDAQRRPSFCRLPQL